MFFCVENLLTSRTKSVAAFFLEKRRVIFVEGAENALHDGLPEQGGFCFHIEATAILLHRRHLFFIEANDMAVSPDQGGLLLLQIGRIYSRVSLFLPCHNTLIFTNIIKKRDQASSLVPFSS